MPNFYNTLLNEKPLKKEGYLRVTKKTSGNPLIIANILSSTTGEKPDIQMKKFDEYFAGTVNGIHCAFTTKPGHIYNVAGRVTNALAVTWNDLIVFAAKCTLLKKDEKLLVKSIYPITVEVSPGSIKYSHEYAQEVELGIGTKPGNILVNGRRVKRFNFNESSMSVSVSLPQGEGRVEFK